MYEATEDPYCYPGTTVLKNRLNLRTQAALEEFETFITAQRADEPLPSGRLGYSHYRAIHRHLFQDVYVWAGRVRVVRITKGSSTFCYPEHIDREMKRVFGDLQRERFFHGLNAGAFAAKAAHFLAELNAIHPFREGNGRTQLAFLSLLAERAGHPLAFEQLDGQAILAAMIDSFQGNEAPLAKAILDLIGD
jgi:cell filamentation protein